MNQAELASQIARNTGLSKAKAECALKATLKVISSEVEKGETVKLVGFGTFKKMSRSARTGFNPQTKKAITIPARIVPKFVPGKEFKALIQSGTHASSTSIKAVARKAAPVKKAAVRAVPKKKVIKTPVVKKAVKAFSAVKKAVKAFSAANKQTPGKKIAKTR